MNVSLRRAFVAAAAITFAVVAIAPTASAQFGRRQRSGGENGGYDAGIAGPPPIPKHVAALVLEHAGELALADSQRTLIESVRRMQDSANRPWLAKLDSLRPTSRPVNPDDLSQEQRDEIATRRAHVAEVMEQMRETNAQARIKVMAALNADQQKQAAKLEDDARKHADDEGRRRSQSGNFGGDERRRGGGGMGRPPVI